MVREEINWELFLELTRKIPNDLDRDLKKQYIPKNTREKIKEKYKDCQLCGGEFKIGSDGTNFLQIHHIIPNGTSTENNLIVLCKHCHQAVHNILFVSGKWRFVNLYRRIPY